MAIEGTGAVADAGTNLTLARYTNDGNLDNTFGSNGILQEPYFAGNTIYNNAAIQSDGKIIAVGSAWNGTDSDFALARYNTYGTLDNTFDGDGKQTTDIGFNKDATSVAIQSDGKIVIVGNSVNGNVITYFVARYNPDGSPDNTFNGNGKQIVSIAVSLIKLQNDEKILVSGSGGIARYNTDGTPDVSFNGTGKIIAFVQDFALQADGKILLLAGGIARYNVDGSVDHTFVNESPNFFPDFDPDNSIDFYNGNTLIFTEHAPPFYRKWYNVKEGEYTITARATDNNGLSTTSAPVHITVLPENILTVNITSPLNGASYTTPATFFVIADAKGPTITKVDFYNGSTLLFTEYKFPYSKKWHNVPPGNYSFTAKATDINGNVATSLPVAVTVIGVLSKSIVETKSTLFEKHLNLNANPNPVSHTLNLSVDGLHANSNSTISIISASGATIKTMQLNGSGKNIQLDVSFLAREST